MIGIDIVENSRMKDKDIEFIKRILSSDEFSIYSCFTSEKRKVEYLASRFAVKEALFKAYKKGNNNLNYSDISVLNDEYGAPYIKIKNISNFKCDVSLSHENNYSVGIVIIR